MPSSKCEDFLIRFGSSVVGAIDIERMESEARQRSITANRERLCVCRRNYGFAGNFHFVIPICLNGFHRQRNVLMGTAVDSPFLLLDQGPHALEHISAKVPQDYFTNL